MTALLSLFICVITGVKKEQRFLGREKIAIMPRAKNMEAILLIVQAIK